MDIIAGNVRFRRVLITTHMKLMQLVNMKCTHLIGIEFAPPPQEIASLVSFILKQKLFLTCTILLVLRRTIAHTHFVQQFSKPLGT